MEDEQRKKLFSSLYRTEYTDHYNKDSTVGATAGDTWNHQTIRPFSEGQTGAEDANLTTYRTGAQATHPTGSGEAPPPQLLTTTPGRDPGQFYSELYPSVYRETVVRKDDRGNYIDTFKPMANKSYGRRLIYDPTHPDKMYASQWSSELADPPGPYSFPTTTGLDPEIPWTKDMQWQMEGETGQWPTDQWKDWCKVAECPPYDGYTDQVEYDKYKVQIK